MSSPPTRWGLVATILAPREETLKFCAFHLRAGAHRLFIYLDDPDDSVFDILKAHPKIRPTRCTAQYWQKHGGKRPIKHQVRQTKNASRAYRRAKDVDWLGHIDVDEFLVSQTPVADQLGALSPSVLTARVRPMEVLAGDPTAFKRFIPNGPDRSRIVARLYPNFGPFVGGGFLSHVGGKVFARTGREGISIRIHNTFQDGEMNPNPEELGDMQLAHLHAKSWEDWIASYRFRLEKGSYRAELGTTHARAVGGVTLHELLRGLEEERGEAGLREFYDELCAASPALIERLQAEKLLYRADLQLANALAAEFPAVV